MSEQAPASKEEVVVMTGVRARMAAYKEEIKRKEQVKKKHQPRFMVADDLGPSMHSRDKDPVEVLETSISQIDHSERDEGSEREGFDRSMNLSGRPDFFGGGSNKGILDEGIDAEPEKTQEVKDEEEKEAKETLGQLLGSGEDTEGVEESEPIVLQSFARVQRRYMNAVTKLRPTKVAPKKVGQTPEGKEAFKQEVNQEMGKSRHLTALANHWDDYYDKAQDKDDEPEEVKIVEEELKQVESEVQQEWEEYAEIIVEAVDDVSVLSDDSDMLRWRDEARRLKAEAEDRKRQKTIREERRKKRASVAAARKKRAEEAAKRKAEEIARRKAEEAERAEEERLLMEEEAKKAQEEAKKARAKAEEVAEVSEESDSDSSVEEENTKVSKRKSKKKKDEASEESDSDSSVEEENTKVSKKKSKKKKDKDKPKDKKKKSKKKDGKKKTGNDESDLEDGWVEEYPRNLDGTLWKNVLKYWTNKPKKLNEIAPKVIMKPNANSDIFCKTEDQLNDNGCFYWHKFDGDFNVLVKIKANLKTSYDKAGILIRQDERNWVMSGLEFFNKRVNHSSCITRGISDWSLAPLPDEAAKDGIWIAIKRNSNKVECFYSFDLKEWVQTRQGLFPTEDTLKVGIVAACPMGEPFKVVFERFRIQMVG